MNIISVSSPVYSRADNSTIDCSVTFDNGQTYPYTASASDTASYGLVLWAALNAGTDGTIAPFPG